MALGTPVVVLAHGGARTVAEGSLDADRIALVPPPKSRSVNETVEQIGQAIDHFISQPYSDSRSNLDRSGAVATLHRVLRLVLRPGTYSGPRERALAQSW